MPLMLIDGEFGTFALVSEVFDFLINNGFIAVGLMLCILRFLLCARKLGKMSRRSLVVFAEDPSEDLEPALLSFYMWEFCFP